MSSDKKPTDVFTPRSPHVNEAMYVDRPELERAFTRGIQGSQHVLIHGESGTGKSWLYKRTLHRIEAAMVVANLANAARLGSIVAEISAVTADLSGPIKTGFSESKAAEANAFGFVKGSLEHTSQYKFAEREPLELAFERLRTLAGNKCCCLVLDNLETIFNHENLMSELGEIIVLLDDERYAKHRVKLVVVGVPSGVREYFSRVQNRTTVTNRLVEIPEVAALSDEQVNRLIRTGFLNQLAYQCTEPAMLEIVRFATFITGRVPQMLHEFCLELAYVGEDTQRTIDESMLDGAAIAWLQSSLSSAYTAVESMMNDRNTVAGRRNQILFALGQIEKDDFTYSDIESLVRRDFPESTSDKTLNISGMLSDLSDRKDSLIKRSPKGNRYLFVDPKYRMCLRVMLKNVKEKVDKVELRQLPLAPTSR